MKLPDQLSEACEDWRHWTELEGEAIEGGDWAQVCCCQREKDRLQPRIEAELQAVISRQGDNSRAGLRSVLNGLIALENENADRLSRQRSLLSAQNEELNNSSRNLRRLQSSYTGPRNSQWHSYS